MKKDAYYFPHFCNARNDSKIIKLRRVLGLEGYGIYFMLLEVLREQTDYKYPISGIEDLSYEWHTSKEKIATVINDFELFEIIDIHFFSSKLVYYLQPYIEKSERARLAANKRWNETKQYAKALQMHNIIDANVLPEQCSSNASKGEESKGEESKLNEINIEKSRIFYDKEIEKNKEGDEIKKYKQFVDILFGKNKVNEVYTGVLSIPIQLKYSVFCEILKESKKRNKKISSILMMISNKGRYYEGFNSLPILIYKWMETDYK
jgi:hypothetical protein